MRFLKKALLLSLWSVILTIWVIGGIFYFQITRSASEESKTVLFKVERGMTLEQVTKALSGKNLIRSASAFRLLAYLQGKENKIQAGEFKLSPKMTPVELLNTICSGHTALHSLTIPEGYRITEIARQVESSGFGSAKSFIRVTHSPDLIRSLHISGKSLEGYLFPDTYFFSRSIHEKDIAKKMVGTFIEKAMTFEFLERAKSIGLSFHEVITLASIIEKETGNANEREHISSVFHNRLKKNMRLQSDPTVIYNLPNYDGNIHKRDLFYDSPYNTYRYKGLPPGPIASPGLASIRAALYPIQTKDLYFVSRQNGSHYFSSNLKEHNKAVRKYQLHR